MPIRLTTKEFKIKGKIVHGDKYNYNQVDYVNNHTKVSIGCNEHGFFLQIPKDHLNGRGCPKCGNEQSGETRRTTIEEASNLPVVLNNNGKILDSFMKDERVFFTCKCDNTTHQSWNTTFYELKMKSWCKNCYIDLQRNKWSHVIINEIEKQIIEGTLLGDGTLTSTHYNFRLRCIHSQKQIEWLNWKAQQLENLYPKFTKLRTTLNSPININGTRKKMYKKYVSSKSFQTISCQSLTDLESIWYRKGKKRRIKIIPSNFRLTELSAAIWYLDDGCNRQPQNTLIFYTNSFTEIEVDRLVVMLKKLGYKNTKKYKRTNDQWIIRIFGKSYRQFLQMVSRVIKDFPNCMKYKIDTSKCPLLREEIISCTGIKNCSFDSRTNAYYLKIKKDGKNIYIYYTNKKFRAIQISKQLQQMKQDNATEKDYMNYKVELAIMK